MKKLWKMRNSKGFTIVELVVVIAIIGILAGVTIPSFVSSKKYVDDQEQKLYQELSKLDVTPHGTLLDGEISTDKVEIGSVSVSDAEVVQVGAVTTIQSTVEVKVNGSVTNDSKYDPYKELIWTSSDTSIANVSNGIVAGYQEGTVTITATSVVDKTKTDSCTVTVTPAQAAVAMGGSMSFACKCDDNDDGKCDITGEELPDGSHVHTVMSDVTSNYCFLQQCANAQRVEEGYFTYTKNLDSTHIPTVYMDTDYVGDLSVDFYGVDKDGENQRIAMILDLNGKTIKGCVNINGIANITSTGEKGKIINTESDTSDGIFISGAQSGDPLYTGKVNNVYIEANRYGVYVGNGAQTKNDGGIENSNIIAGKVGIYVGKKVNLDSNYRNIRGCNISAPIGVEFHANSSEIIQDCKIFATDIGVYLGSGANVCPRVKNSFIHATNYGIKGENSVNRIKTGSGNFIYAENHQALYIGSVTIFDSTEDEAKPSIYYSEKANGVYFAPNCANDNIITSFYYNHKDGTDTVESVFETNRKFLSSNPVTKWITDANYKITYEYTLNSIDSEETQSADDYTAAIDNNNHTFNVTSAGTKSLTNLKYLNVTVTETARERQKQTS